jgi:hypothetical protein
MTKTGKSLGKIFSPSNILVALVAVYILVDIGFRIWGGG